jgi:hypothetical protein
MLTGALEVAIDDRGADSRRQRLNGRAESSPSCLVDAPTRNCCLMEPHTGRSTIDACRRVERTERRTV